MNELPKPDIRVTAFGEVEPTDGRSFVMGDFFTADQMLSAIQADRERCAKLVGTFMEEASHVNPSPAFDRIADRLAAAIRSPSKEG